MALDNSVWRMLFSLKEGDGWRVDLRRASKTPLPSLLASLSPLELNWYDVYRNRQELDRRWSNYPTAGLSTDLSDEAIAEKEAPKTWEPKMMRISGHGDRCAAAINICVVVTYHVPTACTA